MGEIRRSFGTVRQLASGQFQARYYGADGLRRVAPYTFTTKRKAEKWLVATEAEILRGDWVDPEAGWITLGEYAKRWVAERDLKARTREEYERLLRLHLLPYLGNLTLSSITSAKVRTWRTDRLVGGVGRSTVAKTYRILHAVFATAVDDDLVRRNPCRIKGAGSEHAEERPTATLDQVLAIAGTIQPRYRLLVLLATFAQLRFGELVALRRNSIDLDAMEVRVRKATAEMQDGTQVDDDPKSRAGIRPISLPAALKTDIEWHLTHIAQPGPMGRLFIGPRAASPDGETSTESGERPPRRPAFPSDVDLHLHDLRHTGSTWSAQTGATLKEVMARIGHSSTRAAMIYQHATRERDQAIATALDALIDEARRITEGGDERS